MNERTPLDHARDLIADPLTDLIRDPPRGGGVDLVVRGDVHVDI